MEIIGVVISDLCRRMVLMLSADAACSSLVSGKLKPTPEAEFINTLTTTEAAAAARGTSFIYY